MLPGDLIVIISFGAVIFVQNQSVAMNRITPIFPCKSLDELLVFYQSLGFEITYYQRSPNPYATIEKDWIRLDFYGIKYHDPKKVYHTCYIMTDNVDDLYEEFTTALRNKNGNLPSRGLPRISDIRDKPKDGVREFQLVDIAGTCLRFGKKLETDSTGDEQYSKEVMLANNRLSLALDFAYKSEGEEDELETVAKVLDKAIAKDADRPCVNLYKVMILRADIAIECKEYDRSEALLSDIRKSDFIMARPEKFKSEMRKVAELEGRLRNVDR